MRQEHVGRRQVGLCLALDPPEEFVRSVRSILLHCTSTSKMVTVRPEMDLYPQNDDFMNFCCLYEVNSTMYVSNSSNFSWEILEWWLLLWKTVTKNYFYFISCSIFTSYLNIWCVYILFWKTKFLIFVKIYFYNRTFWVECNISCANEFYWLLKDEL